MGIQKAFFYPLTDIPKFVSTKKLSSHYIPFVNERHKTAVNVLYPQNTTFESS